jgi:peptidoglycan/LPS O-acetylase OafA/YrhL
MPLYLLAVFTYFAVAIPLAHHWGAWQARDASSQMWFWLHLSNWPPAFGTVVPFIGHFWSLSVEEQFYLVWPLVVFLVAPRRLMAVCVAVIAAALVLRVAFLDRDFVYYLTPFRMDALGVGCLAATIVRNERMAAAVRARLGWIVGGAASIVLLAMFAARSPRPFNPWMCTVGYTCFALLYGCFVFAAYSQTGTSTWLALQLRRPLLRSFGKYSYAIYVFHTAIITAVDSARIRLSEGLPVYGRTALAFLAMAVSIAASYAAARVSWSLLERRCLALKSRFAAR